MAQMLPHFIKVQMGEKPDWTKDGQACIRISDAETSEEMGVRLAQTALALSSAGKILSDSQEHGTIINIDGTDCNISISNYQSEQGSNQLAVVLSELVLPSGWKPA